eukprot:COSAG02_NODE_1200_length_13909_cov_15.541202_12_plen_240_part_00
MQRRGASAATTGAGEWACHSACEFFSPGVAEGVASTTMGVRRRERDGGGPAAVGVRGRKRKWRGRCCENRMVAQGQGPGRRAGAWLWASVALPAAALAQEVACAGRGVRRDPDDPNERCPDWSTDGICPENCAIKSQQDHCGTVCTAGPTVAVIASVLVVIVFLAGLVFGARPVEGKLSDESPEARGGSLKARKQETSVRSDDFTSNQAFENAVSDVPSIGAFENAGAEAPTNAFEEEK